MKKAKKLLIPVIAVVVLLAAANCGSSAHHTDSTETTVHEIRTEVGFEVADDTETELEPDTCKESEQFDYQYIYDAEYLDRVFGSEPVTEEDVDAVIDVNPDITGRYVSLIKEYVHLYTEAYPDADLRILYNNLKTIKVVECESTAELMSHTLSYDSYACYMRSENVIYTAAEYEYEKGTWDYQVIMHELSHAARTYWRDTNGNGRYDVKAQFEGLNLEQLFQSNGLSPIGVSEAMNSVFTVRMFDYEDRNIAYQLQSNYYTVILDSIDNYQLSDYINHSLTYFAEKLDEAGGYHNYAAAILQLMETQYNDYHSDDIEIAEENYYPIYDFIADLYFRKYITADMSEEEMSAVCDELVERVTYDVPEEYHIDSSRFYEYLAQYSASQTGCLS